MFTTSLFLTPKSARFSLALTLFGVLALPLMADSQPRSAPVKKLLHADQWLQLPSTLGQMQQKLGRRFDAMTPGESDESGGWGNTYRWNFKNGLVLTAQTDSFEAKDTPSTEVRSCFFKAKNGRVVPTIQGLVLNQTSRAQCQKKFGAAMKPSVRGENHAVVRGKRVWASLTFNSKNQLTEVLQTTFNMESAG